jgi:hypothetical protein
MAALDVAAEVRRDVERNWTRTPGEEHVHYDVSVEFFCAWFGVQEDAILDAVHAAFRGTRAGVEAQLYLHADGKTHVHLLITPARPC